MATFKIQMKNDECLVIVDLEEHYNFIEDYCREKGIRDLTGRQLELMVEAHYEYLRSKGLLYEGRER